MSNIVYLNKRSIKPLLRNSLIASTIITVIAFLNLLFFVAYPYGKTYALKQSIKAANNDLSWVNPASVSLVGLISLGIFLLALTIGFLWSLMVIKNIRRVFKVDFNTNTITTGKTERPISDITYALMEANTDKPLEEKKTYTYLTIGFDAFTSTRFCIGGDSDITAEEIRALRRMASLTSLPESVEELTKHRDTETSLKIAFAVNKEELVTISNEWLLENGYNLTA